MSFLLDFFVFVMGTVFGSFAAMLSSRLLQKRSMKALRSSCDHCGHLLGIKDLFPVLSYLGLRGKCRYCGERIGSYVVWMELGLGLISVFLFHHYPMAEWALWGLIITLMVVVAVIDAYSFYIYDSVVLSLWVVSVILAWVRGVVFESFVYSFLIVMFVWIVAKAVSLLFRKDSLGGGDLKLLYVFGWLFSFQSNVVIIFISSVAGIFYMVLMYVLGQKSLRREIPYGPFLVFGAIIIILGRWSGF